MSLVNISKPVTSFINVARASFGELWSTIITTWATETRTWQATGSLFANVTKQSSSMVNTSKPA